MCSGAGALTVTQGADATVAGVISGTGASSLTKAGASTLTLSGANTYTGTTNVNAGTLSVTAANALHTGSSLVVNGGTLDINNVMLNTLAGASVQGMGQGGVGAITGTGAGGVGRWIAHAGRHKHVQRWNDRQQRPVEHQLRRQQCC